MDSKSKNQLGVIDGQDTPEEYRFSNPCPTDPPKRNFWIDEGGHIRVKNLSAFWLPEFTLQKEIGGTVYTVTGSYDGAEPLNRKMERIMAEKFTEKMEDSECQIPGILVQ